MYSSFDHELERRFARAIDPFIQFFFSHVEDLVIHEDGIWIYGSFLQFTQLYGHVVLSLDWALLLVELEIHSVYFLWVNDVYSISVVMFSQNESNLGNIGTVLSHLDVLTGIQHWYPVGSGDYQRIGMVIHHEANLCLAALDIELELILPQLIIDPKLLNSYSMVPSLYATNI